MGTSYHEAIIITATTRATAIRYYKLAKEIFKQCPLTYPTKEATNSISTFMIAPDGSKEGWNTSIQGDKERLQFLEVLKAKKGKLGYSEIEWVWVKYGFDLDESYIVANHKHFPDKTLYEVELDDNTLRNYIKPLLKR